MALFSNRHHEWLASVMQICEPQISASETLDKHIQWETTIKQMGDCFQADNPAFNYDKFISACRGNS